ncbi:ATP-binding protein [Streptomyces sp. NPDC006649]|uniref:ATP-binding protein n=1 Tax=Streptomyces sp. NPDC006649 TaxID=3156896 RepID=UPI0033AE5561
MATAAQLVSVPPGRGYRLQLRSYDESGRGLLLLEALADRWGVAGRSPGKVVWCEWGPTRTA